MISYLWLFTGTGNAQLRSGVDDCKVTRAARGGTIFTGTQLNLYAAHSTIGLRPKEDTVHSVSEIAKEYHHTITISKTCKFDTKGERR